MNNMNNEFNMNFPIVKNIQGTTIADSIQSVQPSLDYHRPLKRKYKNHMGDDVIEYDNGFKSTYSYHSTNLYGEYGHSFGRGFFIVDESGDMIFAGDERYNELAEKCMPFWKIHKALQERFPGYSVSMSRGERLAVNDKIIKGITYYPGMLRDNSEEHINGTIECITKEIQIDIDNGRIVKGEYGID